jgi:Mor family transcriptional regulator
MKPEYMEAYPSLLEDAWQKLSARLQAAGYDPARADESAFRLTEYLRSEWSGRMLYIRKRRDDSGEKQDDLFETESAPRHEEATSNALTLGQLAAMARRFSEILGVDDPDRAAGLGAELLELLRADWAGELMYISCGKKYDITRRDYALWREWDGSYRSKFLLIGKYKLHTEQAFYAAVRRIRKAHKQRTQPVLPGVE